MPPPAPNHPNIYTLRAHSIGLTIPAIISDIKNYYGYEYDSDQLAKLIEENNQVPRLKYPKDGLEERRFFIFAGEALEDQEVTAKRYDERGFPRDPEGPDSRNSFAAYYQARLMVALDKIRPENEENWSIENFIQYIKNMGYTKHEVNAKYFSRLPKQLQSSSNETALDELPIPDKYMDDAGRDYVRSASALGIPPKVITRELKVHGYSMIVVDQIKNIIQGRTDHAGLI